MITRDDIVVTSVLHEGNQQYLFTAKVALQARGAVSLPVIHNDERVLKLKDRVLHSIYGDVRRQLDFTAHQCRQALLGSSQSFDGGFSQVMEAIQSVRDVLDGRQEDD